MNNNVYCAITSQSNIETLSSDEIYDDVLVTLKIYAPFYGWTHVVMDTVIGNGLLKFN